MAESASPSLVAEHMLIVCGPSGVGKSTLVQALLDRRPTARVSVSYTTRAPRGREQHGVDYHFVDVASFEAAVAAGRFAEWARVHGNLYGTARETIESTQRAGLDAIFDIDYQGAAQLKASYPGAWAVLVAPPDMTQLEQRLRGRNTDADDVVARRLEKAREELAQVDAFDFVVVNDALDVAVEALLCIYDAMTRRRERGKVVGQGVFAAVGVKCGGARASE